MTTRTPESLRLFAALELPSAWAGRLAEVIASLKASLPGGGVRWVRSEGIHLTLKFYGDVAPGTVPALQSALARAAASVPPISLEMEGLGVFPNLSRPRVIWADVAGDVERLTALQKAVEQASAPLGFKPEGRGFAPHLTLGRVNGTLRPAERQILGVVLERTHIGRPGAFTAEALSLMRSELRPGGSVYTRLFAASLGGRNN